MEFTSTGKIKSKLKMKIIGRDGKERKLPLNWKLKNTWKILKENFLRKLGFDVGYADVLTQGGEEQYATWLDTGTQYIGWGTGSGTHSKSSTSLFNEIGTRVQATRTKNVDRIQYEGALTASDSVTITNAGVFTASTGGTLIVASDFTGISLNAGEGIKFQWTVEIT